MAAVWRISCSCSSQRFACGEGKGTGENEAFCRQRMKNSRIRRINPPFQRRPSSILGILWNPIHGFQEGIHRYLPKGLLSRRHQLMTTRIQVDAIGRQFAATNGAQLATSGAQLATSGDQLATSGAQLATSGAQLVTSGACERSIKGRTVILLSI